jgi:uncharacterized protein YkwD
MLRRFVVNFVGVALIVLVLGVIVLLVRGGSDDGSQAIVGSPLGLGSARSEPLYPEDDPWAAYLAPESVCPGGEDRSAPVAEQERTMICLLNWARARRGQPALPVSPMLAASARLKAEDIVRCSDFAHEACGKEADSVAHEVGYSGFSWGENLYAGPGEFARPRVAVDRWLNSDGHRENLFRDSWQEQGVALRTAEEFDGYSDAAVWVSHFGRR